MPLYLHLGVYDSHTCEPLPAGTLVEIWGANATGTYSGVGVDGDPDNVHTHFLRGLQPLSDAGSTWFRTIFPGHYASRTNHVHLLVHVPDPAATQTFANGTVAGHLATWTGQLFFDQALIDAVETVPPYSSNTLPMTKNAADVFLANEAVGGSESLWDPMVEWAWVDGAQKARSGVVAWIALGVNVSEARSVEVVGVYSG